MKIYKKYFDNKVIIFTPKIYYDKRGFFYESCNLNFIQNIIKKKFIFHQSNISMSKKNVVRGLHFQTYPFKQSKILRVLKGAILDIVVDIRKNSKTFGQHHSFLLTSNNKRIIYISEGFAHGFKSLEHNSEIEYFCSKPFSKKNEKVLLWNDSIININWGTKNNIIVSKKDSLGIQLHQL
jgi:dTDP-4-dehydrorhamnose 3,5-epimerase